MFRVNPKTLHVGRAGYEKRARALVVHVEVAQRARARRVAVAVGQRAELLQALGDRGREAVLAGHVRVQDDVYIINNPPAGLVACMPGELARAG